MDSQLIYRTSEKQKHYLEWINPGESEYAYSGIKEDIKVEVLKKEIEAFFENANKYNVAITKSKSLSADNSNLISTLLASIGRFNVFVWSEDFQRAIEFGKIGVFRKGKVTKKKQPTYTRFNYNKISATSPDKVKGQLVKYRKGDCLSLSLPDGNFLAVLVSEKFNKYYDLTPVEFLDQRKPTMEDFINGRFFGNYNDIPEGCQTRVEKHMYECLVADSNDAIEKVGSVELIDPLEMTGYRYFTSINELYDYYISDITKRTQQTIEFEKHPHIIFITARLINMREIIKLG